MRFARVAAAFFLFFTVLAAGCRREPPPQTPVDLLAMLRHPGWQQRLEAAEELRENNGPPPEAVPHLYAALQSEQVPHVYDAMLITFGASGAAEAKPLIDARINDPDEDVSKAAHKALKRWLVRNMLMTEDEELPPQPHAFYGPVQVPPGAPASRPMLPPPPMQASPTPTGAPTLMEDRGPPPPPADAQDSSWPLPPPPPPPTGGDI